MKINQQLRCALFFYHINRSVSTRTLLFFRRSLQLLVYFVSYLHQINSTLHQLQVLDQLNHVDSIKFPQVTVTGHAGFTVHGDGQLRIRHEKNQLGARNDG